MAENQETEQKKRLTLGGRSKLELKRGAGDTGQVRQSFSHGRSKAVQVEMKRKKRSIDLKAGEAPAPAEKPATTPPPVQEKDAAPAGESGRKIRALTSEEREARLQAIREAAADAAREREKQVEAEKPEPAAGPAETTETPAAPAKPAEPIEARAAREGVAVDDIRAREEAELRAMREAEEAAKGEAEKRRAELEAKKKAGEEAARQEEQRRQVADRAGQAAAAKMQALEGDEDSEERRKRGRRSTPGRTPPTRTTRSAPRKAGRITVTEALNAGEGDERVRSLASVRRARERERQRMAAEAPQAKQVREVTIPDAITVQELSNRMAERAGDVVKALMRMGVMATITQSIDADTAELLTQEFGHKARRVSEADVETGIEMTQDVAEALAPRAPIVAVMGHVDHGKTSLLDALRKTDVASGEAGGITQHIGAYQVTLSDGRQITFLDTPGHAAFTQMRARGATVTDVAVIVVAADDSVMPQTIEALNHARAANVPTIIAVNKCDLPGADPMRVRQDLLQHEIVVEEMGGETLSVDVSAKTGAGLDKLEEAILLQAELLELKANPEREARGTVVEAKIERGRGSVATVLISTGTLKVGDAFIAGDEWGRVRALLNDRGEQVDAAGPSVPVEVLGLNGTPGAGDEFIVVETEARARDISEFRQRKKREKTAAVAARGSVESMFDQIKSGAKQELGVVLKGDVHGSVEAIAAALEKLTEDHEEIAIRILHTGVGAISESDINLAKASDGMILAFNVRANPQARDLARQEGLEIRYYSVIYTLIDEMEALLSGMLSPQRKEVFIGYAEIRQVFNISKVGKVGGCYVTEGLVKRGAGVRLLRDNVVVHEGTLKTLKRFKDEVKEVREGTECGMAFENYDDIKEGDVIEAFEIEEVQRSL